MRVVTWNLQGNHGLDAVGAAAVLRSLGAGESDTLVLVQEIQREQSRELQRALGAPARRWSFKHWGVRVAAEGLAVFAWSEVRVRTSVLSRGVAPWQWQRRTAQFVDWQGLRLVNTHLATGADGSERARQVERILAAGAAPDLLAGDWNEATGPATDTLLGAGYRDAWVARHRDRPLTTNWSTEDRSAEPDQLLDRIWSGPGLTVEAVDVADWRLVAPLSDHVPLVAQLRTCVAP